MDFVSPRVHVDSSFAIRHAQSDGVRRVVTNVNSLLPKVCRLPVNRIAHFGKDFYPSDENQLSELEAKLLRLRSDVTGNLPQAYTRPAQALCKFVGAKGFANQLLPPRGRTGIFGPVLSGLRRMIRKPVQGKRVEIGADDILVLPDAYWARPDVWPTIDKVKRGGTFIATVVYDLIPIEHPEFVAEGANKSFEDYLARVIEVSDIVLAISQTVCKQIKAYADLNFARTSSPKFDSFTLGADISNATGPVRDEIREHFHGNAPYLMVSSFDPRKNHAFILNAFEQLWAQESERKLCLLGRIGWRCDQLLSRIANHPELGKRLFVIHDASEAELTYCYQRCRAALFPSVVEGFGLPLIEAAWHGKQVFASDTPIHREVAKQQAIYFDLNDSLDLLSKLRAWEKGTLHTEGPEKLATKSWDESVTELWKKIALAYEDGRKSPRVLKAA